MMVGRNFGHYLTTNNRCYFSSNTSKIRTLSIASAIILNSVLFEDEITKNKNRKFSINK